MPNRQTTQTIFSILFLLITGITIGWLTGLSVSPVVSTLIASITGFIASILISLNDINSSSDKNITRLKVNPIILGVLTFGILIGSILGISARNYHWLGSEISSEVTKWTSQGVEQDKILYLLLEERYPSLAYSEIYSDTINAEINFWTDLGIEKSQVVQRIFDRHHTNDGRTLSSQPSNSNEASAGTSLFAIDTSECDSLLAGVEMSKALSDDQHIVKAFKTSTNNELRDIALTIDDSQTLQALVEEVLCSDE